MASLVRMLSWRQQELVGAKGGGAVAGPGASTEHMSKKTALKEE